MSKNPPIPEEAKSPFPIEEAPHDGGDNETVAAIKEMTAALKRWEPSRKQIGLGAAVGIGSAAIVASLLYWRGNNRK
jgi:hypothetical protein